MSILRALFGPSKEEIWRQLAEEIGGAFSERGFLRGKTAVQAKTGDWIITLDAVEDDDLNAVTRLRAPYVNPEGFTFEIHRAGIFSRLETALGWQDIEVGYPRFDRDFVIKGNSPARVRGLFANDRIRSLISLQPKILLSVKRHDGWFSKFPEGVHELYFKSAGVLKDLEQLRGLFDLFTEVLHQVCHDGRAYEDDVQIHIDRLNGPGGRIEDGLVLWEGDEPRLDAAEALGRLGDPMAVTALASALRDGDRQLRIRAIDALAAIPHVEAVQALIPLLGDSSSTDAGFSTSAEALRTSTVRDRVAEALRNRGEAELVEMVVAVFAGDLTTLTSYEGEHRAQVVEALVAALEGYFSGPHAARALAEMHAVETLPRLRNALRRVGTRDPIGQAIAEAIEQLEARASLPRPAEGSDVEPDSLPRAARGPGPQTKTLPRGVEREE